MSIKFIAFGELGGLAKLLQMLGYDCIYDGGMSLYTSMRTAAEENRILLTLKPVAQTKRVHVVRIAETASDRQLKELAAVFPLIDDAEPFSRCLVCSTKIQSLPEPETVSSEEKCARQPDPELDSLPNRLDLPPGGSAVHTEVPASVMERKLPLYRCPKCSRIYWHGSHIERMKRRLINAGFGDALKENK